MNNPILQSERFEIAAYELKRAMENFGAGDFGLYVEKFRQSIDKFGALLGMQAENDQRRHLGQAMAYTEDDFARMVNHG